MFWNPSSKYTASATLHTSSLCHNLLYAIIILMFELFFDIFYITVLKQKKVNYRSSWYAAISPFLSQVLTTSRENQRPAER